MTVDFEGFHVLREVESLAPSRQDGTVYIQRRVPTALKGRFKRESEKYQTQTSGAAQRKDV